MSELYQEDDDEDPPRSRNNPLFRNPIFNYSPTEQAFKALAQQIRAIKIDVSPDFQKILARQISLPNILDTSALIKIFLVQVPQIKTPDVNTFRGIFSEIELSSAQILRQINLISTLPHVSFEIPVKQILQSWQRAIQPGNIEKSILQPLTLERLGYLTEIVNSTALLVESETSEDGDAWLDSDRKETLSLIPLLDSVAPNLSVKLIGAWHVVKNQTPDCISQAANSGIELLDHTLRSLASNQVVIEWQREIGLYSSELNEGKPTRKLKIRYIAHQRSLPPQSTLQAINAVSGVVKRLQKMKHESAINTAAIAHQELVGVETLLLLLLAPGR
ncbi:MAG: hypothetical protein ACR2JX_05835 [Mycobacteriales bacterium]